MELTITPKVEALLDQELKSGRFLDPNDLIETALHALSDRRFQSATDLDDFIQEGIDSADRGELYNEEEAKAYTAALRSKL